MQFKEFTIDPDFKELTQHRTTILPLACYHTTIICNINGYIPMHWHEELQFVLVVKGQVVFQIQEERVRLAKGKLYLLIVAVCTLPKMTIIRVVSTFV